MLPLIPYFIFLALALAGTLAYVFPILDKVNSHSEADYEIARISAKMNAHDLFDRLPKK
jgi:hypothetical protein